MMNVSKETVGNMLDEIENYINKEYKEDPRFASSSSNKRCKFLPGHRNLIITFVNEVKERLHSQFPLKRASELLIDAPQKKRCVKIKRKVLLLQLTCSVT